MTPQQILRLGLLLSLGATGCEEKADDTSTTGAACAALDVDACAADSACTIIGGRPLQVDAESGEACVDYSVEAEALGCMNAEDSCPAVEVLGHTTDGACSHLFSGGCLPSGWSSCETPEVVGTCSE